MFAFRARVTASVRATAVALVAVTAACRTTTPDYIWVSGVPKSMITPDTSAAIAPGDVISVRVWNQDQNSVDRARVREDGRISIPFLNDVEVAGEEPATVARRLEVRLKAFINNPSVTVVVHERRPLRISVVGKVAHPGVFDLDRGSGVLHAIAAAGGLTPYADESGIFVVRTGYWADSAAPARIRFKYDDLRTGRPPAATFLLRVSDVVVVE